MRDQQIVVAVDGSQPPGHEFLFAVDLARRLGIGSVGCVVVDSAAAGQSAQHILLPTGSGERTLSAGCCGFAVFDTARARLEAAHTWVARGEEFRRAARSRGVSFAGYERLDAAARHVADQSATERIMVIPWTQRSDRAVVNSRIWQKLVVPAEARVIVAPVPTGPLQRVIVDAHDPNLHALLPWGYEWSACLGIPLFLVSASRVGDRCFSRRPWLTRVFSWLGLEARIRPAPCTLNMLCRELKPTDLLLTSAADDPWHAPLCLGSRLHEILVEARCRIGILPCGLRDRLVRELPTGDNFELTETELPALVFALRGLACGKKSSAPRS